MKYRITPHSQGVLIFLLCLSIGCVFLIIFGNKTLLATGLSIILFNIIIAAVIFNFYRDPERHSTAEDHAILAPADGMIVRIQEMEDTFYIQGKVIRVAIFMHAGNVHVQRMPINGRFMHDEHKPGKLRPVLDPRAPIENEQRWYAFDHDRFKFIVVQIAGLLARRTINWLKPGQETRRGERLGMIALGSEVDLYFPYAQVEITAKVGQKVTAGETIIGRLK